MDAYFHPEPLPAAADASQATSQNCSSAVLEISSQKGAEGRRSRSGPPRQVKWFCYVKGFFFFFIPHGSSSLETRPECFSYSSHTFLPNFLPYVSSSSPHLDPVSGQLPGAFGIHCNHRMRAEQFDLKSMRSCLIPCQRMSSIWQETRATLAVLYFTFVYNSEVQLEEGVCVLSALNISFIY